MSIKNEFPTVAELNIKAATVDHVNKIIRSLDAKRQQDQLKFQLKLQIVGIHN